MDTTTTKEIKELIAKGCVVYAYPRKKQITVNGGKYYKATKAQIKLVQDSTSQ